MPRVGAVWGAAVLPWAALLLVAAGGWGGGGAREGRDAWWYRQAVRGVEDETAAALRDTARLTAERALCTPMAAAEAAAAVQNMTAAFAELFKRRTRPGASYRIDPPGATCTSVPRVEPSAAELVAMVRGGDVAALACAPHSAVAQFRHGAAHGTLLHVAAGATGPPDGAAGIAMLEMLAAMTEGIGDGGQAALGVPAVGAYTEDPVADKGEVEAGQGVVQCLLAAAEAVNEVGGRVHQLLTVRDADGRTALHAATDAERCWAVRRLLELPLGRSLSAVPNHSGHLPHLTVCDGAVATALKQVHAGSPVHSRLTQCVSLSPGIATPAALAAFGAEQLQSVHASEALEQQLASALPVGDGAAAAGVLLGLCPARDSSTECVRRIAAWVDSSQY